MEQNRSKYQIAEMTQWLPVSQSGYYAWRKRPQSPHDMKNESLLNNVYDANLHMHWRKPDKEVK